uniref:Putative conserved plasma membrane protein n=1 Tax=Culex tarsalis TaxID=7177 RepID=A0A1Q3FMA6_CULTA
MGKKKPTPVEDLIIPPQDSGICGVICICQLTFVLSTVAIVYLTVAIYMPSSRAFKSGIDETPVMCTTTKALNKDACEWGSCGEWCLSKTSGACIQIYVHLRNNGSSLTFQNCTNSANKTCYGIDQENAKKARCIADECKNLTGTFNCTTGMCINITDAFECVFHNTDAPLKCSGRRGKITCIDINGLFSCNRGTCRKIKTPYNCDRRCVDIPTRNKNMILLSGDKVYLSQCSVAIDANTSQEVWNESDGKVIMASCYTIQNTTNGIQATDCVNGSLLEKDELTDLTNFTYLSYLHYAVSTPVKTIAPLEQDLTISNESGLMINLEGCVNTLQDECKDFLKEFGKDGTDHNARARFPCFHSRANTDKVVARFNLETTYKQFVVGFVVPTVLFAISCLTLIFCQKTIHVGDDAKMRFVGCANKEGGTVNMGAKNKANANSGDGGGGGDSVMAL